MSEAPKLTYHMWFLDQAQVAMDTLTDEQLGKLFRAVMSYVATGEETAIDDPILLFAYRQNVIAVDRAQKKYAKKCEKNRENGAKGGRAKAAKAKVDQQPESKGYRPTKTEFKNAVKHLRDGDEIDVDDHNALLFYEELKEAGWTVSGQSIDGLRQLQTIISERFTTAPLWNQRYYWNTFKVFLGRSNGLETAGENNYEFWATFRNDRDKPASSGWKIGGQFYPMSQQTEAIEAFLATASER